VDNTNPGKSIQNTIEINKGSMSLVAKPGLDLPFTDWDKEVKINGPSAPFELAVTIDK
jgi:hypothetical protein